MNIKSEKLNIKNLIVAESKRGIFKVICFSLRCNLTLTDFSLKETEGFILTLQNEYNIIVSNKAINYIQISENKGLVRAQVILILMDKYGIKINDNGTIKRKNNF